MTNNEEKLKELEGMLPTAKAEAEEALARAEAAEAKLSKAEKEYEFSQKWIKAIEESNKREQERKAEEYAKAVEAAEWRRQQNEAARAEERKWNNMTPQELEAEREKCRRGLAELAAQREQALLEKLGSPEAVAAHKKKQLEEIEVLRAEREERLKKEKAEHEAYLLRIGVIK